MYDAAVCVVLWDHETKMSLVVKGILGLLRRGVCFVWVCGRFVVCVAECYGGCRWGAVEKGRMVVVSLVCVLV